MNSIDLSTVLFIQDTLEDFAFRLQEIIDGLEVTVLLPIIILIIALLFRVPIRQGIESAILIGVGFVGIFLVLDLFGGELGPLAEDMVEVTGVELDVLDVGWPAAAAIAFGIVDMGVWVIPIFVVVNLILFAIGFTYTLNVDVWNYWHFAFIAGLVYVATDDWILSMGMGILFGVFILVSADWFQPAIEETFDTPGISIPHGLSVPFAIAAIPVHEVVKRIPGVGDTTWDPDTISDRLGIFGEPVVVGLVLGILIGIGARADELLVAESWYTILGAGITFAAVMHILPMMVGILMEGLSPLAEAIRDTMTKRYEGRDMAIGLDSAILIGHQSVIAASLVIVPIAIVLSIILPGNRVIWGVDLATFPFFFAMMAPLMRGDVVKMVLTGIILVIPTLYMAGYVSPLLTDAAAAADFEVPPGVEGITAAIGDAGAPGTWVLVAPAEAMGDVGAYISLVVLVVFTLFLWVALRLWPKRMYMIAGATEEKAAQHTQMRHTGEADTILPNKLGEPIEVDEPEPE